ncbi:50S ribosomal protein L19 [Candidatus Kaiserbacteria bacterium]|nr:MAG: 50S ribosomal protein L19 [Candidatus Kaiserbacteria bacterium]
MKNKVVTSPVDMKERAELGIKAGDTVRVWLKIEEKGKTRLQAFEGLVLARKHGNEAGGTFTVRKVTNGVGVEKIFPLYMPSIDKIEIVKRSKVRRAKLYFIRDKVARELKRVFRRTTMSGVSTKGSLELEAERKVAEAEETKRQEEEAARQEEEEAKAAAEAPAEEVESTEDATEETKTEEEALETEEEVTEEAPKAEEETKEEEQPEEKKEG